MGSGASSAVDWRYAISTPIPEPLRVARQELLPRLDALGSLLESEGDAHALAFFARIANSIRHCQETEDLAEAFLALSTSAFQGFQLSPASTFLVDQVLEQAQQLAHTLSADPADVH